MPRFDNEYDQPTPLFGMVPSREMIAHVDNTQLIGRALDIGCGDGRDSIALLRRGFRVTAVDESSIALEKLRAYASRISITAELLECVHADLRVWTWPRRRYDLVNAVTILDHLEKKDIARTAASMVDAVVPGGLVFVQVLTVDDPAVTGVGRVSEFADCIRHYFDHNELLRLFLDALQILRYEERMEWDHDHGEPHMHGMAIMLGRKPTENSSK